MADTSTPNVLLILTDQQSADAMSCRIGNTYISTPAMDSIASNGVLFTQAYCVHPLCVPSRTSLFTGRYPHETGVLSNADTSKDISAFQCLGKVFDGAGYDTGYVGKWHLPYPIEDRQTHGFGFRANIICNGADLHNADEAIRFLRTERDAPFFLVVSYNNPHNICEWARGSRGELPDGQIGSPPPMKECPPLKYNHLPEDDEAEILSLLRRSYHASPTFPVSNFGEREWREYLWAYYRMVETVDERIGHLLAAIDATGQRENTVVVFLSDHGDAQGAHRWNQKTVFYDESSRVPFVVSYPEKISPGVSNRLVQSGIDLVPTLCDIAGIEAPGDLPGISLFDTAAENEDDVGRSWIVCETRFVQGAEIEGAIPQVDGRMIRSLRFKYCVYEKGEHRESLVDMEQDPGETVNLARKTEYLHVLDQHREYLREFCSETGDSFPVKR